MTSSSSSGSDADRRRVAELERTFRRDGLPNLIVGRSAADDFTHAVPFLAFAFVLEIARQLDRDHGGRTMLVALGVFVALVAAHSLAVAFRRRHWSYAVVRALGPAGMVAFVVVPAGVALVRGKLGLTVVLLVLNLVILAVAYVATGFGLVSILRWAGLRLFAQLAASRTVLIRAVPLLLFFSLVMFFTAEIWEVFTSTGPALFWTAIALFGTLAVLFLVVRLPGVVRETQFDLDVGDVPLRRRERLNLAAVALVSEMLQVLFVSAAVWLFYVILGTLLVSAEVRTSWLGSDGQVLWELTWLGEQTQVTTELLRVATGVAAFSGLYYAVAILVDPGYRDQFVDSLTSELRATFVRRAEYHQLLARVGGPRP